MARQFQTNAAIGTGDNSNLLLRHIYSIDVVKTSKTPARFSSHSPAAPIPGFFFYHKSCVDNSEKP